MTISKEEYENMYHYTVDSGDEGLYYFVLVEGKVLRYMGSPLDESGKSIPILLTTNYTKEWLEENDTHYYLANQNHSGASNNESRRKELPNMDNTKIKTTEKELANLQQSAKEAANEVIEEQNLSEILASKDTKALREHLKIGVKEYRNSDTFKEFLDFASKMPNYSSRNIRLVLAQNKKAMFVASFKKWGELGNPIKKRAKSIKIMAPVERVIKDKDGEPVKDENGKIQKRTYFSLVPVFDQDQTINPEKIPTGNKELSNDLTDKNQFINVMKSLEHSTSAPIKFSDFQSEPTTLKGRYNQTNHAIEIRSGMGQEQSIKTAIHEIAHSDLHKNSDGNDEQVRKTIEFEAESIAYIVSNHLGIDTSDYTFGYLNSYGIDEKSLENLSKSLETITKEASQLISKIDNKLLELSPKKEESISKEEAIDQAVNLDKAPGLNR